WNDDRVALMVADPIYKIPQCFGNVDTQLQDLPIKDRKTFRKTDSRGICEEALDDLDWKLFGKVYGDYILAADTPSWPSFSNIFSAYLETPLQNPFNTSLGGLSCSDWTKWASLHPLKQSPPQIPRLDLQGPPVKSLHDLIYLSLKFATSSPSSKSAQILSDAFFREMSNVCGKCRASSITMYGIYKAANEITNVACRASVLGGRGDRLGDFLAANKAEVDRVMGGYTSVASAGMQVDLVNEKYYEDYFEYEDEYWTDVEKSEKASGGSGGGVLGGLFGGAKDVERGRVLNLTGVSTDSMEGVAVFFD
ncbi:hypothetical protein HDU99_004757, partial [Rhizoclosmatium hyalinum]